MNTPRTLSVGVLVLLAMGSLACSGLEEITGGAPSVVDDGADDGDDAADGDDAGDDGDDAADDGDGDGDDATAGGGDLPEPPWSDAPGWIALAARADAGELTYTPVVEGAAAVVFEAEAWDGVAAGTKVMATGADGAIELSFRGVEEIPYGCDGNTQRVAVFEGEELAEGTLWLQAADAELTGHRATPAEAPTQIDRKFAAGPATGNIHRVNDHSGVTLVKVGGEDALRVSWSVPQMDGIDRPSVDMTFGEVVGAVYPEVYLEGGEHGFVVTRTHGYEGVGFTVTALSGGEGTELGEVAIYRCAM